MKNRVIFLDSDIFNTKYTIAGMSNNSLIINDREGQRILVHRRVLNAISSAKEPIPCSIMEREYRGKKDKWLATFFTV